MSDAIIVGLLSLLGTGIGTLSGVIASSKKNAVCLENLTVRLSGLEKKVDIHNNYIDRTYKLEERMSLCEERLNK